MSRTWLLTVALIVGCSSMDPTKLSGPDPASSAPPSSSGAPSSNPSPATDGGGEDAGAKPVIDAGGGSTTDYNTPVVCSSGVTTSSGGSQMHPGGSCNGCHAKQGATIFTLAGTIYPTAHEPDDCHGVASNAAQIIVLDSSNSTQLTLYTNASGNFSTTNAITTPYRIKVIAGGKERDMLSSETNGDCNSCHTERGTSGAPGRIMSP